MWPNWSPPDDIELDGHRHTAPLSPLPGAGPDTDVNLIVEGNMAGQSPMPLFPPYRTVSANTMIPGKGVMGVGPQTGETSNVFPNLGTMILPGWQGYLEMGGQLQVGLLPRTVATMPDELWDQPYVLNPSVEVV